jgi:oxygen-independent coproporphyrinogen III oxidase
MKEFIPALHREMEMQSNYLEGETINTIYLGGGTPSMLEISEIKKLLEKIHNTFPVNPGAEITLEANPDDLEPTVLSSLKTAGINRLSIGIQSFRDEDLLYMNRVHNAVQAGLCITQACDAGFENLSVDLLYGVHGLSNEAWEANLEKAISLQIPHISAYALTVEDKTPLEWLIRKGKLHPPDENNTVQQFEILMETMEQAGYQQYEISNFCRQGNYSRHNTAYWNGEKYLGLGPSAHSYDLVSRQWNVANLQQYLSSVNGGELLFEKEILSRPQKYNEYIMTSLRTMWGCDLDYLRFNYLPEWVNQTMKEVRDFITDNMVEEADNHLVLTRKGKLFADRIASALFIG